MKIARHTLSLFKYIKDYFAQLYVPQNVIWKRDFVSVRQRLITTPNAMGLRIFINNLFLSFFSVFVSETALTNYFIQRENIGKKMPSGTLWK